MHQITKDIEIPVDGSPVGFRLTKLDAFSGVMLLRLLMKLEDRIRHPTMLDLVAFLSEEELRSVMTSLLNHTEVLLPAGPHPVMEGGSWGYPEIEHNTAVCMRLLMEGLSWNLSGFFGGGGRTSQPASQNTSQ